MAARPTKDQINEAWEKMRPGDLGDHTRVADMAITAGLFSDDFAEMMMTSMTAIDTPAFTEAATREATERVERYQAHVRSSLKASTIEQRGRASRV